MRRLGRNIFLDADAEVAFGFDLDQVLLSLPCCCNCEMTMPVFWVDCKSNCPVFFTFFIKHLIFYPRVLHLHLFKSVVTGIISLH
jgi:hypothetical protein